MARTDNPVRVRVDRVESDERRVRTPPRDVAVGWRSERVERSEEESGASDRAKRRLLEEGKTRGKQQKEEVYGEREEARKEVNGVQKREWEIEEKRESKRQLEEMRRAEFAKNIVTKDK